MEKKLVSKYYSCLYAQDYKQFSLCRGSCNINEPQHGNPIEVSVSRATPWKIN